ncbi:Uncharacterised protein [Campylobacter jejuni]|nr:Uncharacterised protein [Campylobacter jejuni]
MSTVLGAVQNAVMSASRAHLPEFAVRTSPVKMLMPISIIFHRVRLFFCTRQVPFAVFFHQCVAGWRDTADYSHVLSELL